MDLSSDAAARLREVRVERRVAAQAPVDEDEARFVDHLDPAAHLLSFARCSSAVTFVQCAELSFRGSCTDRLHAGVSPEGTWLPRVAA